MRKRAKVCFECKALTDVLYRCRYCGEKAWIFLCENCLSLVKKNIKQTINVEALGKAKRNDEKFCNLYFICMGDNDRRISCRLDDFPPTLLLMELFF